MKKILMSVDFQKDFVAQTGALPVPFAPEISAKIQKRIDDAIYAAKIFTFDTHKKSDYDKSDEKNVYGFPIHCVWGTPGWGFYDIKPTCNIAFNNAISDMTEPFEMMSFDNEFFFTKDVFNIWDGNNVYAQWFEKTFPSDEFEIDVVGVATNYCVMMNVMGMVERGYKINVIEDCVRGITNTPDGDVDESYDKNITIMKNRGVKFITSASIEEV